jgi:hypothetical protein
MNFLDKLKEEWTALNESITTFNTPEHQEIIRKMDRNTDQQERLTPTGNR